MSLGFSDAKSVTLVLKNSLFTNMKELISSLNVSLRTFMVHHSKLTKRFDPYIMLLLCCMSSSLSKQKCVDACSTFFSSP